MIQPSWCVFFAVPEEARPFWRRFPESRPSSKSLERRSIVTGMGTNAARASAEKALTEHRPDWVITAGFAGGLKSHLKAGDIVVQADPGFPIDVKTKVRDAQHGSFVCVPRLAATAAAKQDWARRSGADAIEMESRTIRELCLELNIPSATIRVISDSLDEDLPLDFARFMDASNQMQWSGLVGHILSHPGVIPRVLGFRKRLVSTAESLSSALAACIRT